MNAGAGRADDRRGPAEVIELSAFRRAHEEDRQLSDLQLALLRKARRLRRRGTVRH